MQACTYVCVYAYDVCSFHLVRARKIARVGYIYARVAVLFIQSRVTFVVHSRPRIYKALSRPVVGYRVPWWYRLAPEKGTRRTDSAPPNCRDISRPLLNAQLNPKLIARYRCATAEKCFFIVPAAIEVEAFRATIRPRSHPHETVLMCSFSLMRRNASTCTKAQKLRRRREKKWLATRRVLFLSFVLHLVKLLYLTSRTQK